MNGPDLSPYQAPSTVDALALAYVLHGDLLHRGGASTAGRYVGSGSVTGVDDPVATLRRALSRVLSTAQA